MIFINHNTLYTVEPVSSRGDPTQKGTREMCRIVQDVRILRFYLVIHWDHTFLSDVSGCRKTQVLDCISSTVP
jgi:hypothetical protein